MSRLYSHPCEHRKIFLGNYLCIGFVPGGIVLLILSCQVTSIITQQLTYGVVSKGVFAESLRKVRGNYVLLRQERVRKFCGNLRKIFCNDPFPNDPISKLLKLHNRFSTERFFLLHVPLFPMEQTHQLHFVPLSHSRSFA